MDDGLDEGFAVGRAEGAAEGMLVGHPQHHVAPTSLVMVVGHLLQKPFPGSIVM
jgi:hypothetical protein